MLKSHTMAENSVDNECISVSVSDFATHTHTHEMAENDVENELLDYEEEEQDTTADAAGDVVPKKEVKGTYVSIHSSGFRDFLLKPELLRAIVDCGFEHPSEGKITCRVCL